MVASVLDLREVLGQNLRHADQWNIGPKI
jgi:hypothetical protein